jgi:hypothetical protein
MRAMKAGPITVEIFEGFPSAPRLEIAGAVKGEIDRFLERSVSHHFSSR